MLDFTSIDSVRAILSGIEMIHMVRAMNPQPSLAEQFKWLAASAVTSHRHLAVW